MICCPVKPDKNVPLYIHWKIQYFIFSREALILREDHVYLRDILQINVWTNRTFCSKYLTILLVPNIKNINMYDTWIYDNLSYTIYY